MQWKNLTNLWGVITVLFTLVLFVGPTQADTLQSWDQKIDNANRRFKVLRDFNDEAVLDKETQLVWERSPSTDLWSWYGARNSCMNKEVGGRLGWRLPSVHELSSLIDRQVLTPEVPKLPANHPFINVQGTDREAYWAAQTVANSNPEMAFRVLFGTGGSGNAEDKFTPSYYWCVRGGSPGPDTY